MHISKNQLIAILGIILLGVGVFLPIIKLPLNKAESYLGLGDMGGMATFSITYIAFGLISISLLSLILVFIQQLRWLLLTGFATLAAYGFTFYQFKVAKEAVEKDFAANLLMGLANANVNDTQLYYGWIVLGCASILILTAGIKPFKP